MSEIKNIIFTIAVSLFAGVWISIGASATGATPLVDGVAGVVGFILNAVCGFTCYYGFETVKNFIGVRCPPWLTISTAASTIIGLGAAGILGSIAYIIGAHWTVVGGCGAIGFMFYQRMAYDTFKNAKGFRDLFSLRG